MHSSLRRSVSPNFLYPFPFVSIQMAFKGWRGCLLRIRSLWRRLSLFQVKKWSWSRRGPKTVSSGLDLLSLPFHLGPIRTLRLHAMWTYKTTMKPSDASTASLVLRASAPISPSPDATLADDTLTLVLGVEAAGEALDADTLLDSVLVREIRSWLIKVGTNRPSLRFDPRLSLDTRPSSTAARSL